MPRSELLFDGVGTASVHHVAIQVRRGMLIAASTLLNKLGFIEIERLRKNEDWGAVRFFVGGGSVTVQLTELDEDLPPVDLNQVETHVAFCVDFPEKVAQAILMWAYGGAQEVQMEEANDGKYFIRLPSILFVPIELVPRA